MGGLMTAGGRGRRDVAGPARWQRAKATCCHSRSPLRGSQAAEYSVDETADELAASDGGDRRWSARRRCGPTLGWSKLKTALPTTPVVVGQVVGQDALERPATDNQEVVADFGPEAGDPSFSDRVRHRGAVGSADHVGALGPPHLLEGRLELGVVVRGAASPAPSRAAPPTPTSAPRAAAEKLGPAAPGPWDLCPAGDAGAQRTPAHGRAPTSPSPQTLGGTATPSGPT
jgi:hypothetical protein